MSIPVFSSDLYDFKKSATLRRLTFLLGIIQGKKSGIGIVNQ